MHMLEISDFVNGFEELVKGAKKIVLTSHISPDDDAIGSLLALYSYLSAKYKEKDIKMFYTGHFVDRYVSFTNYNKINFVPDIVDEVSGCDVLICLDGGRFDRFSRNPNKLKNGVGKKICIDHHATEPEHFDLSFINADITSTSELVYKLFFENKELHKDAAEAIFMGMLGDSGNFTFLKSNQSYVFSIAQVLLSKIESGVQEFQTRYSLNSQKVFDLVKILMNNTKYVEIVGWPKCMYTTIGHEEILAGKYNEEEVNDAKHWYMLSYLRNIAGYPWGFVISAKLDNKCGVTFRSLPESVNVRNIVEKMGIGGGHDRAAGGTFEVTNPEKCVEVLLDWLSKNDNI